MTHRFLHIGDTHLQAAHPRNGDRLAALDQVIVLAQGLERLAAILWPGDLYHAKSTVDDRNALIPRVIALANLAPVILTYGNHDEPGDLEVFAKLQAGWPVYVVDRPQVMHVRTATTAKAACFVLPYPHKAGLVGAGVSHEQLGQAARAALEPVFLAASAELAEAGRAGEIPLAIGHVNVGGALASQGQPQIGREIDLDAALLARLGSIYIGLNHIHRHQAIAGAVYAGSIARMDFGEAEGKGVVVVECQQDGAAWEQRWRFSPLAAPRQILVEGRLTRAAFTIGRVDGEPYVGPLACGWAGADVRVKYSYRKAEIGALDVAKIHAEFAGCRSLKLDPQPDVERDVRAPEVVAAVTLDAKVEAYCQLNGLAVSDGLREKLSWLQARPEDVVLEDVRRHAAGVDQAVDRAFRLAQDVAPVASQEVA